MESSGLTKEILDYYYKFGQNRNLEKYLRLRRNRNYQKSSSEGSINTSLANADDNYFKNIVTSKSLDNLTLRRNQSDEEENGNKMKNDERKQNKVKIKSPKNKDYPKKEEFLQLKHTKSTSTHTKTNDKKDTKPPYSFSCESHISINLPLSSIDDKNRLAMGSSKLDDQSGAEIDDSNEVGDVSKNILFISKILKTHLCI